MDYITAWDKLKEYSEKEKTQMVHTFNNPYGNRININHPKVLPKYEEFRKKNNIGRYDMTDELRERFEEEFMASDYYRKLIEEERKKYGPAYDYIYEPLVG